MTNANRCDSCIAAEALAELLSVVAEVIDYALDNPQAPAACVLDYAQGYAPDALRHASLLLSRKHREGAEHD